MKISTVSGINGDAPKLLQLFGRAIELIAIAVADAGDRMRLRPNIAVGVLPHGPSRPCLRNLRRRRPVLGAGRLDPEPVVAGRPPRLERAARLARIEDRDVVTGPRQSGKTTLLRNLLARTHEYVSLEPPHPAPITLHHEAVGFAFVEEMRGRSRQRVRHPVIQSCRSCLHDTAARCRFDSPFRLAC